MSGTFTFHVPAVGCIRREPASCGGKPLHDTGDASSLRARLTRACFCVSVLCLRLDANVYMDRLRAQKGNASIDPAAKERAIGTRHTPLRISVACCSQPRARARAWGHTNAAHTHAVQRARRRRRLSPAQITWKQFRTRHGHRDPCSNVESCW